MNYRAMAYSVLMGILAIIAYIAIAFFAGCQSAPERTATEPDACFYFRDCMYRNAKNPDKTICSGFAAECRAFQRYIFCGKETDRDKFQSCWDKLNSK